MTQETFASLVLERMKTNPEEFIEGHPKFRWHTLIQSLRSTLGIAPASLSIATHSHNLMWALNEDEVKALSDEYKVTYREFLRREFIKNIMDEPNSMNQNIRGEFVYGNAITSGVLASASKPATVLTTREMRDKTAQLLQSTFEQEHQKYESGSSS